jgi:hypothetical protein
MIAGHSAHGWTQASMAEREGESSNQPAVAASQLWRGTRFPYALSRLAAPKRKRRRVAEREGFPTSTIEVVKNPVKYGVPNVLALSAYHCRVPQNWAPRRLFGYVRSIRGSNPALLDDFRGSSTAQSAARMDDRETRRTHAHLHPIFSRDALRSSVARNTA